MIILPAERLAKELRRASETEAAHKAWARENRRVFWQCAALAFLGVPVYAVSWYLTDPDQADLLQAGAFCVSYVGPWARFLAFHLRRAEQE
jgi:hypothetical protein